MTRALRRLAFRAARSPVAGSLVRAAFATSPRLLPLVTIERRDKVLRCRDPRPVFGSRHELIVPLVAVPDVFALGHPRFEAVRAELFRLIAEQIDTASGTDCVSVLVNAGPRQDVGQVHFHLTDELPAHLAPSGEISWPGWDVAIRSLPTVPDIAGRFERGFTLVETSADRRVRLL